MGSAGEDHLRKPDWRIAAFQHIHGAMKPYQELVSFIAESVDPEKLAQFHPSKAAQARVDALVEKHKDGALRKSEREELETFLQLEHGKHVPVISSSPSIVRYEIGGIGVGRRQCCGIALWERFAGAHHLPRRAQHCERNTALGDYKAVLAGSVLD